jgi:hypothetical protein
MPVLKHEGAKPLFLFLSLLSFGHSISNFRGRPAPLPEESGHENNEKEALISNIHGITTLLGSN